VKMVVKNVYIKFSAYDV